MALDSLPKVEEFSKLTDKEIKSLNSIPNISLRFTAMVKMLELKDYDLCARNMIQERIQKTLKKFYPNCLILKYGSSINGYGFRNCDLDMLFLPFPEYCNADFKDTKISPVPKPHKILKGEFPKEDLLKMDEVSHLKFIQHCLYGRRDFFERITFIPAKCPILNITLKNSDIHCDLSASNRLVIANSELLWLYSKLDARVRPLVFALRYWGKCLGFISKSLLSSYAFTILIIFALQNTEPPVLPSVSTLISMAEFSYKVDGWETAFCTNVQQIPKSQNISTIEQLLLHFFDFYWNFDFIKNVVSPYYGKPLPVQNLKHSKDERIADFQVTPFSIQDPLILSRNLIRSSIMKTSFKLILLIAKQFLYEKRNVNHFFNPNLYQETMKHIYKKLFIELPLKPVVCTINPNYNICCNLRISNLDQELDIWYEKASKAVFDILQYGLLFDCEVIDMVRWRKSTFSQPPKKKIKLMGKPLLDIVGNLELIMQIQCAVNFETWRHRGKVADVKTIEDEADFPEILAKENSISLKLVQKPEEHFTKPPIFWLTFDCYRYPLSQIPDIVVAVSYTSPTLCEPIDMFKSFIPKVAEKLLCDPRYML